MNVKEIIAERILSPTHISLAPYTINPYRGCPLGCLYCYAQENKAIKKRNEPWGTFIDAKINAVALLEKELQNKSIDRVLLGSTVECYPPQEKDFSLTRAIIETLNRHGIAAVILTKSCLIKRDLALISQHKGNKIYLTVNFDSEDTKKLFEPFSPSIKDRINVLKQIQHSNINNRVHIAPVFPSIQNIETIAAMVGDFAQEISVELYNFKMGGWKEIRRIIKDALPETISQGINHVISSKERYEAYVEHTKNTIGKLRKAMKQKIFLIAPGFKDYYRSDIRYE